MQRDGPQFLRPLKCGWSSLRFDRSNCTTSKGRRNLPKELLCGRLFFKQRQLLSTSNLVNFQQRISENQEQFIAMLNEPAPADQAPGAGSQQAQPGSGDDQPRGVMTINVTTQEKEAIERVRK